MYARQLSAVRATLLRASLSPKVQLFWPPLRAAQSRKWIETAKLWPFGLLPRGGTDRASGEGGGGDLSAQLWALHDFDLQIHESGRRAVVLQGERERGERRVRKDTGNNKQGGQGWSGVEWGDSTVLSLRFTMSK